MRPSERWRRAEDVFHRALERDPSERRRFVDADCGDDMELRRLVHDMLAETSLDGAPPDEPAPPRAPLRFGRYTVVREIGRGGMGVVYEAKQLSLNRSVALKVLRTEDEVLRAGGTRDKHIRMAARFVEEAEVLGLLDHPGIVPILELAQEAGVTYFTMRLVQGEDLRAVLEKVRSGEQSWTMHRALGVIQRVCDTMSFAHHRGVLHRDLKPSNIMVGAFGEVYIIDWGLARLSGRADTKDVRLRVDGVDPSADDLRTIDGDVIGTPAYMAPEQARGRLDAIGEHSDVYSVGAVLYQLLAGHPPYMEPGRPRHALDVLEDVRRGPPAPLVARNPGVAPELAAICDMAMARDAARRYPTMAALGDELDAYLSNRVVRAYRTGPLIELRMWYVRNRTLARLGLSSLAAILLALVFLTVFSVDLSKRNDDVFRLSVGQDLHRLTEEADDLWPCTPVRAAAMKDWLKRADALVSDLSGHEQRRDDLRRRALPWSEDDRRNDRETHPRAGELAALQAKLRRLTMQRRSAAEHSTESLTGDAHTRAEEIRARALTMFDGLIEQTSREIEGLEPEVARRRTWRFDSRDDEWWQEQLCGLIDDLHAFADPKSGALDGLSPTYGWGVRRRLAFAESLDERTVSGDDARARWLDAIAEVADARRSPHYRGLTLTPQRGLLPIGKDPDSRLMEFWHVQSGSEPRRDMDGRVHPKAGDGVVLVLLPGGTFAMGAQSADPAAPNYDPHAERDEGDVHSETVSPFLISKFEMTQDQWRRFAGGNPSAYPDGWSNVLVGVTATHPVEQVDREPAELQLSRMGLRLPTEAEWEYACRAGTDGPYWPSDPAEKLDRYANLADRAYARSQISTSNPFDDRLDDGFLVHAPVGSFLPNPFGLYDTHGNVVEWCAGWFSYRGYLTRPEDRSSDSDTPAYVARGGGFASHPIEARSANRIPAHIGQNNYCFGVRPCRSLIVLPEDAR